MRNRCTSSSSSAMGAGVLAYSGASVSGYNNIVYMNTATTQPNVSGNANFTYCCVEGGLAGTGNISDSPDFIHTLPSSFCMLSQIAAGQSEDSPCVDAGSPSSSMITGSTRTDWVQDSGTCDMGFHWVSSFSDYSGAGAEMLTDLFENLSEEPMIEGTPETMELRLQNHPNPFNPTTTISLILNETAPVELAVYDMNGRLIQTLHQGNLEAGAHQFLFQGNALPTGLYIYRANVAERVLTGKALLVK